MAVIEKGDFGVRSSELEMGLSSNYESEELGVDTVVSKLLKTPNAPLSSSLPPFHALFESCCLKMTQLKSIRKRFQFPRGTVARLPRPNENACNFAHSKVCFYEAAFSCGLCFPIHPFIMSLLSALNHALGQLIPNAWRTIISCMSIWVSIHEGNMISLNEFLHLYRLKLSTHYGYYELLPWNRNSRIVSGFLLPSMIGNHNTFLFLALDGKPCLTTFGMKSLGYYGNGRSHLSMHFFFLFFFFLKKTFVSYM